MLKYIGIITTIVVTSLFFFPFNPTFLPIVNTKMVVAGIGLTCYIFKLTTHEIEGFNKDYLYCSMYAIIISFLSLATSAFHDTGDYSYYYFFISMWVWTGGAYGMTLLIKKVHGELSIRLVSNYLIAVCVLQCIIALSMDYIPAIKQFVDSFVAGEGFMGKTEKRLYGIGCALDVAGGRFAAILCIISYFCINNNKKEKKEHIYYYIISFFIILTIGNMIGRTTTVGGIVAIGYWLISSSIFSRLKNTGSAPFWKWLGFLLLISIPIIIYFYNTNASFHANLRFGFEGFFNWVEKGKWETTSNTTLTEHMIVFPERLSTWVFGDGYMANPIDVDPYYTGKAFHGFYMGTDIGYLRFLFYFGIIGTIAMIAFITKVALVCVKRFPEYKSLFFLILIMNLLYWGKVSTDLYLVFAPFLLISREENDNYCIKRSIIEKSK